MSEQKNPCSERACVPFFIHENAMMHKDADNERMAKVVKGQRITNIVQTVVILLIVFIMAMFYTSRTQMWNDTISKQNQTIIALLNDRIPVTEVTDGVHQQSSP